MVPGSAFRGPELLLLHVRLEKYPAPYNLAVVWTYNANTTVPREANGQSTLYNSVAPPWATASSTCSAGFAFTAYFAGHVLVGVLVIFDALLAGFRYRLLHGTAGL